MQTKQLSEQDPADSDAVEQDNEILPSFFGLSGPLLMGLAALTRQLERCPRGARILERLAYAGFGCAVLVTWIKYGHS
jgi:hypothetical protein